MVARRDDDELVDALYPAQPGAAQPGATGGRPDDTELAGLHRVRALMRDYAAATDEEPPARGLDALLAAAAAHAPRPAATAREAASGPGAPGAWARLRRWLGAIPTQLVAHPAWASAAALTLVAGVTGAMLLRGGAPSAVEQAAPVSDRPAAVQAGDPAAQVVSTEGVPALPPAEGELGDGAAGSAALALAPGPQGGGTAGRDPSGAGATDEGKAERQRNAVPPPKPTRRDDSFIGGNKGGVAGGGGGGAAEGDVGLDVATTIAPTQERAKDDTDERTTPVQGPTPRNEPTPPPPADPSVDRDLVAPSAGTSAGAPGDKPSKKPRPIAPDAPAPSPDELRVQLQRARGAALRKDCPAVRQIAARLRTTAPTFYAEQFAKDATIKPCL